MSPPQGRRDFRPILLSPGECLRFNGTLCRHFTRINRSGRTRVSLDFRCTVPEVGRRKVPYSAPHTRNFIPLFYSRVLAIFLTRYV